MSGDFGPSNPFWTLGSQINEKERIVFCYSITSRASQASSLSLDNFMDILRFRRPHPVLYEVLHSTAAPSKLYFDIDKVVTGIPEAAQCTHVLEEVLYFLRLLLGVATLFAVSHAHRSGKISFHITCPGFCASVNVNKKIAALAASKGLPVDTAVYHSNRQLMRTIFATGEKADSVPLIPVAPYVGVFSDHIIQAFTRDCVMVNAADIPAVPAPVYALRHKNLVEDLLSILDMRAQKEDAEEQITAMKQLNRDERSRIANLMKFHKLYDLYVFKSDESGQLTCGLSGTERIDSDWEMLQGVDSFSIPEIYVKLEEQGKKAQADEILKSFGRHAVPYQGSYIVVDLPNLFPGQQVAAVSVQNSLEDLIIRQFTVPSAPVVARTCELIFSAEQARLIMSMLNNEQITSPGQCRILLAPNVADQFSKFIKKRLVALLEISVICAKV